MERTAERHQEHYCWVKIVAPAGHAVGGIDLSGTLLPKGLRNAFESTRMLKKLADGEGPPGNRPPPDPPLPPPPPPPDGGPPGVVRAGAAARRPPPSAWRVERGAKWSGDFGMELVGVSGDRGAACEWIDSEEGRRWRQGAVGLDLVLFTAALDD